MEGGKIERKQIAKIVRWQRLAGGRPRRGGLGRVKTDNRGDSDVTRTTDRDPYSSPTVGEMALHVHVPAIYYLGHGAVLYCGTIRDDYRYVAAAGGPSCPQAVIRRCVFVFRNNDNTISRDTQVNCFELTEYCATIRFVPYASTSCNTVAQRLV